MPLAVAQHMLGNLSGIRLVSAGRNCRLKTQDFALAGALFHLVIQGSGKDACKTCITGAGSLGLTDGDFIIVARGLLRCGNGFVCLDHMGAVAGILGSPGI